MNTNIASVQRNVAPRLASNRSSDATKQTLDTDLIRRIAAGNKLAMQLLYMRHNVRLFRFALRFIRNKATVKTRMFYARKHLAELLCRQGITTAMA
jgi:RNA polymerase sigma-70 factor (ECF subfamily)